MRRVKGVNATVNASPSRSAEICCRCDLLNGLFAGKISAGRWAGARVAGRCWKEEKGCVSVLEG